MEESHRVPGALNGDSKLAELNTNPIGTIGPTELSPMRVCGDSDGRGMLCPKQEQRNKSAAPVDQKNPIPA